MHLVTTVSSIPEASEETSFNSEMSEELSHAVDSTTELLLYVLPEIMLFDPDPFDPSILFAVGGGNNWSSKA